MRKVLFLVGTLISISAFGQQRAEQDSLDVDSLQNYLGNLFRNWDPQKEPWSFVTLELTTPGLTVTYGQQNIHPFLAEYRRKIQFSTTDSRTDTLDMLLNSGGRTLIEVYVLGQDSVILEDSFGQYFFNLSTWEYSEKHYEHNVYPQAELLGTINGQDPPLRFEPNAKK